MLNKFIRFFLENRLVTGLLLIAFIVGGIVTAPFNWNIDFIPRDPVPVDAIPDIGENQQIVFTEWTGRSPQDIEDQVSYPLTTALLGIPGVKTIRSSSMFGFSSIYIIFEEEVEFYWSRSRILEKLNSLPKGLLPDGVNPALGPDATALGQIYWYTLEGRDQAGNPIEGWDPHELRSIQDFYVRYALAGSSGVSEVASIGGFVKEYQVDVDPLKMKAYNVTLGQVISAVKNSNLDIGARTIEINRAEYLVRGLGYIESLSDLEEAVVKVNDNVPIRIKDISRVNMGPATRRGMLDKGGAEAVGGVVVARYGSNPLEVINNVKEKIDEIAPGLPSKTLANGNISTVTIVPFYDRTQLIQETLGTLNEALFLEILVTILVVLIMVRNLKTSIMISGLLPVAVLMVFIAMKYFGVDANIVALSGIAIAIGTMVDVGILLSENILRHLGLASDRESKLEVIYKAVTEVASAVLTAISTTVISFIPVFTLQAAEGKLFRPLAFTKTFALIAAVLVALVIIPTVAYWLFGAKIKSKRIRQVLNIVLILAGFVISYKLSIWAGILLIYAGVTGEIRKILTEDRRKWMDYLSLVLVLIFATVILGREWLPVGPDKSLFANLLFVILIIGLLIGFFYLMIRFYENILRWCLKNKAAFLSLTAFITIWGMMAWIGFNGVFGFMARGFDYVGWNVRTTTIWSSMAHQFPGTGKEFMPSLDEGSFLLMPTSMPHSGVQENREVLSILDRSVNAIPEVESVVGKAGRVNSALDPAPLSMFENIINYKTEYALDENGYRIRFRVDKNGEFLYDASGDLIPDNNGKYFRQWRDHIKSPDDIWQEIVKAANVPGVTSAPKLQPIETRLIMLQTGMRAPMGIKVSGPDLATIEGFGLELENILKQIPSIKTESVFADRIVGKPYLLIDLDRERLARYGLTINQVQQYLMVTIGGMELTQTIEGRERYPVRVRYPRELRDNPDVLKDILIPTPGGIEIRLGDLATINYEKGPQVIKSEDTFLIGYVLFDKLPQYAEVNVVETAQLFIRDKIEQGSLVVPAGINYRFTGNYENQVRAEKRLAVVIPVVLIVIFLILYFQFKSARVSLMVFSGVVVAFAGGFILIWLYGKEGFMDFSFLGSNFRDLFQMHSINLSIAVWVGFIALFGIATDGGVVMATYLNQVFSKNNPSSLEEVHSRVIEAGKIRIRPTLMTTATTILALLPVLSSTGRGSDIMVPMAIPSFGGMLVQVITLFMVPVFYSMMKESQLNKKEKAL